MTPWGWDDYRLTMRRWISDKKKCVQCHYLESDPNRPHHSPHLKGIPSSASELKWATNPCQLVCISLAVWMAILCLQPSRRTNWESREHDARLGRVPSEAVHLVCLRSRSEDPTVVWGFWESCPCEKNTATHPQLLAETLFGTAMKWAAHLSVWCEAYATFMNRMWHKWLFPNCYLKNLVLSSTKISLII
jgi:hypothetical protein